MEHLLILRMDRTADHILRTAPITISPENRLHICLHSRQAICLLS
jgi:hypothetical protein